MRKQVTALFVLVLAASCLFSTPGSAAVTVTGVIKSYNPHSGSLVLKTPSQAETTVYISKTVTVYITMENEDRAVAEADTWTVLEDNLFKGTKVTLEKTEGVVTTIWILEVPV